MCEGECACVRMYVRMCARGWRSGSGGLAMSSLKTFWRAGLGVSFSVRCHSRPFRAAPSGGPRKALVFRRRPPLLLQTAPARLAQEALHRPPIHQCSVMLCPSLPLPALSLLLGASRASCRPSWWCRVSRRRRDTLAMAPLPPWTPAEVLIGAGVISAGVCYCRGEEGALAAIPV